MNTVGMKMAVERKTQQNANLLCFVPMSILILACKGQKQQLSLGVLPFLHFSEPATSLLEKSPAVPKQGGQGPCSHMPFAIIAMALPGHAGPDRHVRPKRRRGQI